MPSEPFTPPVLNQIASVPFLMNFLENTNTINNTFLAVNQLTKMLCNRQDNLQVVTQLAHALTNLVINVKNHLINYASTRNINYAPTFPQNLPILFLAHMKESDLHYTLHTLTRSPIESDELRFLYVLIENEKTHFILYLKSYLPASIAMPTLINFHELPKVDTRNSVATQYKKHPEFPPGYRPDLTTARNIPQQITAPVNVNTPLQPVQAEQPIQPKWPHTYLNYSPSTRTTIPTTTRTTTTETTTPPTTTITPTGETTAISTAISYSVITTTQQQNFETTTSQTTSTHITTKEHIPQKHPRKQSTNALQTLMLGDQPITQNYPSTDELQPFETTTFQSQIDILLPDTPMNFINLDRKKRHFASPAFSYMFGLATLEQLQNVTDKENEMIKFKNQLSTKLKQVNTQTNDILDTIQA